MLNRTLPIVATLFFAGFAAAQEPTEQIISLHVSDNTDLVHFKEGDYVFSFSRAELVKPFAGYEWLAQCTELMTIGDTLDHDVISERFLFFIRTNELKIADFDAVFNQCLKDGNVRIHSTVSGKDLASVRYAEKQRNGFDQKNYHWCIEEIASHRPIYGYVRYRCCVNPSF